MKVDTNGTDAIWITAKDAAASFGHTSLIVQNEETNKWYYFFWGDKAVYLEEVPTENLKSLETFNNWNNNKNLRDNSKNYTLATYIEGDFTYTFKYYKYLVENTEISTSESRRCIDMSGNAYYKTFFRYKNEDYALLMNNCLQNTYEGFKKRKLKNGKSVLEVTNFAWYNLIVPNYIQDDIAKIFGNNKFSKN